MSIHTEKCPACGHRFEPDLQRRAVAAEAVVEKLPKTADGVAVVPGMSVWAELDDEIVECRAEAKSNEIFLVMNRYADQDFDWIMSDLCPAWSTRKAAEAALAAADARRAGGA